MNREGESSFVDIKRLLSGGGVQVPVTVLALLRPGTEIGDRETDRTKVGVRSPTSDLVSSLVSTLLSV